MPETTRFAPSPTGYLHLGHAHAALFARRAAGADGRFLLRIEDIDATRCRPEFTAAILEDLAWLGLRWEEPVRVQSEHFADYRAALDRLERMELVYPCFCTRAEIQAEIARSGQAPHPSAQGPDGPLYPGTCRALGTVERAAKRAAGIPFALRLDMARATAGTDALTWHDAMRGPIAATPWVFGDVVLARKETPASYHLAVTVDDALQGVTLVTRGEDLFAATHVHRLLQALLGLPTPRYLHHALILGGDGRRLAKRDRAATLRDLRAAGRSAAEVRALAGFAES
jgi:glutamyl-Q tRNA(Asp) synthetase